jgi:hypothetical protein
VSAVEGLLKENNRLLRNLAEILLDFGPYGQPLRRKVPRQTERWNAGRVLPPNETIPIVDKSGLDVGFFFATSTINSNTVRHRLVSRSGEGGVFDFDATQQELAIAGLRSPANNGLWTPNALQVAADGTYTSNADALGNYTVMFTPSFPVTLHEIFKVQLRNEGAADAIVARVFVSWYEWNKNLIKQLQDAGILGAMP